MTEAIVVRLGVNTLVGDITPWWWKDSWGTDTSKTLGALRVIRSLVWANEAAMSVSSDRLALSLEVTNETDLTVLYKQIGDLKVFLDEMVVRPSESLGET